MPARVRRRPTDGGSEARQRRTGPRKAPCGTTRPRSSRCSRAGCARSRPASQLEGQGDPDQPDEVPGRRAAHARRARPRQGRRVADRRHPRRPAQAARRDRDDPRADRGPRHEPADTARRRRHARSRRTADAPGLAPRVGRRARRGGPRHPGARAAASPSSRRRSRPGRSCRSRCPSRALANPFLVPDLDASPSQRLPAEPARRVGPAQPALPRLRAGRRRRGGLDGPAAEAADRPLLAARLSS